MNILKKNFYLFLAVIILQAMVYTAPIYAAAHVYTNDYETEAHGWTGVGGSVGTKTNAHGNTSTFFVHDQGGGSGSRGAYMNLAQPQTEYVSVSMDIKLDSPHTNGNTTYFSLIGSSNKDNSAAASNVILQITQTAFCGAYTINGASVTTFPKTTDIAINNNDKNYGSTGWVHLTAVLNFNTQKINLTLSSGIGGASGDIFNEQINFLNTQAAQLFGFHSSLGRALSSLSVDNLMVNKLDASEIMQDIYHRVTIKNNGAETSENVKEGATVSSLPQTSVLGKIFEGWKKDSEIALLTTEQALSFPITADTVFEAQYTTDTSYIEEMRTVTFKTFPTGNKLLMSDSTNTFLDNTIALSIIGEDGTDLGENQDSRVNDYKIDWDFQGFRTLNGSPTGDTTDYCDSYGKITIDSNTAASVIFGLKNTPANYYGRVNTTVTYNGKTKTASQPLIILGTAGANGYLPRAGYIADFSQYSDELIGYEAEKSSDNKTAADVLTGYWTTAGSNADRKTTLEKNDDGTKYLSLYKSITKSSAFSFNTISQTSQQIVFEQDVRFNTDGGNILLKGEAPNAWTNKTAFTFTLTGGEFKLNGVTFAYGSKNVWYRVIIVADSSVQKCYAIVKTKAGIFVGQSDLLSYTDNVSAPAYYMFNVGDNYQGNIDFNNVTVKNAALSEETFDMRATAETAAIPTSGSIDIDVTVSAKSLEEYDIISNAVWTIDDNTIENVSITPNELDSHLAVLTVNNGATAGIVPVKVTIGGYSKTLNIKLTSLQDAVSFKQFTPSISIPLEASATTEVQYTAEVINGQGETIADKTITYALYDKNNLNPIMIDGISLDANTGLLTVSASSLPTVFYIRASSTNSGNESISKSTKVITHGLAFDFGAGTEDDIEIGYTSVTPASNYSDTAGFGIAGTTAAAGSYETDKLNGDYLAGDNFAFKVKVVPNKVYNITVTYEGTIALEKFNQYLTGITKAEHTALTTETYAVAVVGDGILDINFTETGKIASVIIEKQSDKTAFDKPTLFAIGDSTIANNGSWAYTLNNTQGNYPAFTNTFNFENKGRGGRNLTSYYNEGLLDGVLRSIKPGDVVSFSGMGTNGYDGGIEGFKEQINYYLDACIEMGAVIIMGSYTPHGNFGAWAGTVYNAETMTFNGARTDGYEIAIREVYDNRKYEESFLGYIDIGKITDRLMTQEVQNKKVNSLEQGKSEEEANALAQARATEMMAWWTDHNHYNSSLSNLILPEITHQAVILYEKRPAFEAEFVNNEVHINTKNAAATALNIFVAEFDETNRLVSIKSEKKAADINTLKFTIPYLKKSSTNKLHVFIWNENQQSYRNMQILK